MPIIETRHLGKDYGKIRAVDSLDLAIEPGELFGFLGPNGAGKTTAISMVAGVLTPTRGEVAVDGKLLHREPFAARRIQGLVPQDLALYEDLSARQNLRFFARLYGLRGAERDEAVRWALAVAALEDRASEPVTRFSGGMKRRLNLAVGLLHRPRVLILDEPTVGVDPQSRAHIFDAVRRLHAEEGMTVVYTSHYMEEVEALCSRIGIMDQGRMVALDSLEGLVSAHAPGQVEIGFEGDREAVRRVLAERGEVQESGERMRVPGAGSLSSLVAAVEATGARITHLQTLQANLETVFLALTGRHLRDAA